MLAGYAYLSAWELRFFQVGFQNSAFHWMLMIDLQYNTLEMTNAVYQNVQYLNVSDTKLMTTPLPMPINNGHPFK